MGVANQTENVWLYVNRQSAWYDNRSTMSLRISNKYTACRQLCNSVPQQYEAL